MTRFFVSESLENQRFTVLEGESAKHANVLRLKNGETVILCDGAGTDYRCTVSDLSRDRVSLVIDSSETSGSEPKLKVSVYMGFAKGDKLEHVIQKATELGAYEIVAFPSARCVVKYSLEQLQKKLPRWQKIARSAAEQSGRGRIPLVRTVKSYAEALQEAAETDCGLFFYENERANTLSAALRGLAEKETAAIVTGPEGGFSPEEALMAEKAGLQVCTLGTRILRCETAPLCALSAVMFAAGEY